MLCKVIIYKLYLLYIPKCNKKYRLFGVILWTGRSITSWRDTFTNHFDLFIPWFWLIFGATRIHINVSWYGSGSDQMIRIRPDLQSGLKYELSLVKWKLFSVKDDTTFKWKIRTKFKSRKWVLYQGYTLSVFAKFPA